MSQEKIGKFISDMRKEKGFTQDDIASRLGITSQSVSKWERGVNTPDISVLKDLSGILGITIEELLRGERNVSLENKKDVSRDKKGGKDAKCHNKKRFILFLVIFVLISGIVVGIFIVKDYYDEKVSETDSNQKYGDEFVALDKDDVMVFESLSYLNFMKHLNTNLIEKLFDKNESIVTKDDLNSNEKMFLTLSKSSKDNGGFIYYAIDCYFKEEDLEKLVFEDTSFIEEYKGEGKHYLIQDCIDLTYERGIYNATGNPGGELEEPNYIFDILEAKRNKDKLVIDFKLGYIYAKYSESENDYNYYSYAKINSTDSVEQIDSKKYNDGQKYFQSMGNLLQK